MSERRTFTGRDRQRRTRWTVRAVDWVARTVIAVGGIGTILAILLVGVSLVAVAAPLFSKAELDREGEVAMGWAEPPVAFEIDEYQVIGWAVFPDGTLRVFRADDGSSVSSRSLVERKPTVVAAFPDQNMIAAGFEDGSVQFCSISLVTDYVPESRVPPELRDLPPSGRGVAQGSVVEKTAQGQFRRQSVTVKVQPEQKVASSAIRSLDLLPRSSEGPLLTVAADDGGLKLVEFRVQKSLVSADSQWIVDAEHILPLESEGREPPAFVRMTGRGDNVIVAWLDGHALRFDTRKPSKPVLAESLRLVDEGTRLTAMQILLGRTTLIVGDSAGGVSGWFLVRRPDATGKDRFEFLRTKELPRGSAAVTSLAASRRTRVLAAGYADGQVRLFHSTSSSELAKSLAEPETPVSALVISPKDDGLFAIAGDSLVRWRVDAKHPEASVSALFSKVWYEGYPKPEHVWQSTGGSVDVEPKFGMVPLIFGTLKATFYAMLFATPVALLAAIYTSEFLDRGTRAKFKPMIETMASLPSVVLGFLAALIVAPFVADRVPAVLTTLVAVPTTILIGAYAWQLLPAGVTVRYARFRLAAVTLLIPLAVLMSWLAAPPIERVLFSGNFIQWLDGRRTAETFGSPLGGWLFLCLPLSAVAVALLTNRFVTPVIIRRFGRGQRSRFALIELGKFLAAIGATLLLDLAVAGLLTLLRLDPRDGLIGTYQHRNAMIVGFVMGFAVIPIIYTIADDALASVPEQLRSASLGAGATQWQTAVRIVIPTAMSGLFSALMIGLGRAVGETMIVVMATGNTSIMEVNPFNGFRTLSANIAVEMSEAVVGSTHYRALFLAGLALFAMTFCVNTVAEIVRLRFRRRVYQL